jgi:hypothetical protein
VPIAESHDEVSYVNVGHEWDISAQQEYYMAVWFETPVRVDYLRSETKQYTMQLNVLQLNDDYDDLEATLENTSDCESVGDDIIHNLIDALKSERIMINVTNVSAVTLRHFSTADLVGVKYDITFNTQSNYRCYKDRMK